MKVLREGIQEDLRDIQNAFVNKDNFKLLLPNYIRPYLTKFMGKKNAPYLQYLSKLNFPLKGREDYVGWLLQKAVKREFTETFFNSPYAQDPQLYNTTPQDFKYITNIISALTNPKQVQRYFGDTKVNVKDILYKDGKLRQAGIKSNDPDSIYQRIERLSQNNGVDEIEAVESIGIPDNAENENDCIDLFVKYWENNPITEYIAINKENVEKYLTGRFDKKNYTDPFRKYILGTVKSFGNFTNAKSKADLLNKFIKAVLLKQVQ